MTTLDDFINTPECREARRALAVKMVLMNFKTKDICELLNVSDAFVSKWKIIYENEGASALELKYKGGTGFLTEIQRQAVLMHLRSQSHFDLKELVDLIEERYGVVYQSRQSYYDLLDEARITWHRTEAVNPKRDEAQILLKREEIQKKLEERQAEIIYGQAIVLAQDECHLLWGDTTGYVWGRCNERIEVPIKNIKERQTYYGVIDLYNKNFILKPVEKIDGKSTADGKNTVKFLEELQTIYEGKKIILIWDGASYHTCKDVKNYLDKVNKGLPKKDWKLTLMLFAPNGPEQNPVEDAWLRGKNFLRKHFYENKTFRQVKDSFSNFLNSQIFNINKIEWYFKIPQPV